MCNSNYAAISGITLLELLQVHTIVFKGYYSHTQIATIKHLKHCHFACMKYTALDEFLVTNIVLGFASRYICHSTRAVYFIQTGNSALSNTYSNNE